MGHPKISKSRTYNADYLRLKKPYETEWRKQDMDPKVTDPENGRKLWELTEKLVVKLQSD